MFRFHFKHQEHDVSESPTASLPPRLQLAHDLVPHTGSHCDVATGHGQLLLALASSPSQRRLIGTDRAATEIAAAKALFCEHNVADRITLLQSTSIPTTLCDYADSPWSLSIMGLGGRTMASLLREASLSSSPVSRLILQPNRDEELVRAALHECGFAPEAEHVVYDRRYAYLVLQCARIGRTNPPQTTASILCGNRITSSSPALTRAYYDWKITYHEARLEGAKVGRDWQKSEDAHRALRLLRARRSSLA